MPIVEQKQNVMVSVSLNNIDSFTYLISIPFIADEVIVKGAQIFYNSAGFFGDINNIVCIISSDLVDNQNLCYVPLQNEIYSSNTALTADQIVIPAAFSAPNLTFQFHTPKKINSSFNFYLKKINSSSYSLTGAVMLMLEFVKYKH